MLIIYNLFQTLKRYKLSYTSPTFKIKRKKIKLNDNKMKSFQNEKCYTFQKFSPKFSLQMMSHSSM
jgi:hypothetical protein